MTMTLETSTNFVASLRAALRHLTPAQLTTLLAGLDRRQLRIFLREFVLLSHEHQFAAHDNWTTWLMLCGRGAGKTRAGAEWVRAMAGGIKPYTDEPVKQIALVGETEHDAREVMIEGVSGILSLYPNGGGPTWISSRRRLEWSNGAVAQVFSAAPRGLCEEA